jgi:competence protein ComEC
LNRGRSVFIRTPENKTILVGGGQNTEIIREITNVTPFYSREINKVIIPSANANQIGGLIEVVNRYEIDEIIIPKLIATSTVLNELKKVIKRNKIHVTEVIGGDNIEIEKDLEIKILFPNNNFKYNKTSLPELGLQIKYNNTSAYLIGNLSKTIQKYIAKNISSTARTGGMSNSIVEFYNSASESKVSKELLDKVKPKFIFSTKERTTHFISDGNGWIKK